MAQLDMKYQTCSMPSPLEQSACWIVSTYAIATGYSDAYRRQDGVGEGTHAPPLSVKGQ